MVVTTSFSYFSLVVCVCLFSLFVWVVFVLLVLVFAVCLCGWFDFVRSLVCFVCVCVLFAAYCYLRLLGLVFWLSWFYNDKRSFCSLCCMVLTCLSWLLFGDLLRVLIVYPDWLICFIVCLFGFDLKCLVLVYSLICHRWLSYSIICACWLLFVGYCFLPVRLINLCACLCLIRLWGCG